MRTPLPGRPLCGECPSCLERTHGLLKDDHRPCSRPAPTAAQLERHARRFGPEGVKETAAEHGVEVEVGSTKRATRAARRGRGPTLRQRVEAHLAAGRGVELIAEIENLSPSRVRRLVKETE
jgi:hypothetical protein